MHCLHADSRLYLYYLQSISRRQVLVVVQDSVHPPPHKSRGTEKVESIWIVMCLLLFSDGVVHMCFIFDIVIISFVYVLGSLAQQVGFLT